MSGNTFVGSGGVTPVTPPPVSWPREPSRIVARNNSKKSGSRFSEATISSLLISEAGLPVGLVTGSKFPPVLSELGETYTHCWPILGVVPEAGTYALESQTKPKQALMFAAVPALMVESGTSTPAAVSWVIAGSLLFAAYTTALGPLYVIQASRLSGNRVLTRGSPTAAEVPSKRVNAVVTRRSKKFGLTAVEVLARAA